MKSNPKALNKTAQERLRAMGETLAKLGAELKPVDDDFARQWEAVTGEPYPGASIEQWERQAVLAGIDINKVLTESWTPREWGDAIMAALQLRRERAEAQHETDGAETVSLEPRHKAIALVRQHPHWTYKQIAQEVGVHPGTVKKWTEIKLLKQANRAYPAPPRGYKKDTGDVEAADW